ncbi:hypothetical protein [Melissospora conviva]|uniref:hypothetical protein n=1 Tax=Melissospora conviva TaxID=3388432 RepID=UPI003C169863
MKDYEMVEVLTKCALFDGRTPTETETALWMETIGDLDHQDAMAAVSLHYRENTDYIRPGHIFKLVKQMQASRRREQPQPHPVRKLPSRFEQDANREVGMARGGAQVREVLAQVLPRLAAKSGRPELPSAIQQLREITAGPDWVDADMNGEVRR